MNAKARLEWTHGERVAQVRLAAPKANILDRPMIADLEEVITRAAEAGPLVALILSGEGPHFSFGASVEEHLPDQIGDTLAALHGLLARILDFPGPTIAAIRGQCLGGGLELALACDLILAEERAQLGQPEIKLRFCPPASAPDQPRSSF
jgi:cyclohexa-1,5-dienecarbonyl-CoA hydratase